MKNRLLTHRCEGGLKNNVSIRFAKQYNSLNVPDDFETWRLFKLEIGYDYDSKYLSCVTEVKFCPFCGERLVYK